MPVRSRPRSSALEPGAVDQRLRQRTAARGRRVARPRLQGALGHRPDRGAARHSAFLAELPRAGARRRRRAARRLRCRSTFPTSISSSRRALHKRGMPVVYYISPQLWAWRRGRLKTMKRVADRVLVIFPFEAPFYDAAGVPVDVRRHPLLELTRPPQSRDTFLRGHGLDPVATRRRDAAGQPAQRAARDSARPGPHRGDRSPRAYPAPSSWSPARRTLPTTSSRRSGRGPAAAPPPGRRRRCRPMTCWRAPTSRSSRPAP